MGRRKTGVNIAYIQFENFSSKDVSKKLITKFEVQKEYQAKDKNLEPFAHT